MPFCFQKTRISAFVRLAALLAFLVCSQAGVWAAAPEMEMQGKLTTHYNHATDGTGFLSLGSASSSLMTPYILGHSEYTGYGMRIDTFPATSAPTTSYPTYGAFYLNAYGRNTSDGSLASIGSGYLFRLDNNLVKKYSVGSDGTGAFSGGLVVTNNTTISGATYANGGLWANGVQITCERRFKTNIEDAFTTDALTLHASLIPRKFNRIWEKNATDRVDASGMASPASGGTSATQQTAPEAKAETVVAQDPSWGFIIDELPPQFVKTGLEKGDTSLYLDPLDFIALNTKVIQMQQQTIATLQKKVETLEENQETKGEALQGAPASAAASLTQTEVEAVADRALVELGLLVEVEVAADDAWVQVDETAPESRVETVTRYRLNAETRSVEPYTAQETVSVPVPTGRKVWQLKEGVRLDEKTGKFLRLMLAPTAPASESEGLAKLLAPALRARFAAALRINGAPVPARAVSMNLK